MSTPEFLAEAQVRIVPNTAGFRQALVAQLTKEVALAEKELAGATRTATTAAAQQATVQKRAAAAATQETAALRAQAKAAVQAARAHEQLARGAGATGLSLLGARGATLAAGSEFLIGAAAVTLLAKAVQGAIEDEETLFGVTKVLGDELGGKLAADASTLASSFGITDDAALKFEGALAATLQNAGVADAKIVDLSKSLVRLAADLGAVRHVPVEDTLKAIQLAISGNTRALRQYGIVIQNSEVQQTALAQTGKKTVEELTRQELTLARLSLLYDRAAFAAGGFQQNADSAANRVKILSAELDQLGDSLGAIVVPALLVLIDTTTKAIKPLRELLELAGKIPQPFDRGADSMDGASKKSKDLRQRLQDFVGGSLPAQLDRFGQEIHKVGEELGLVDPPAKKVNDTLGIVSQTMQFLIGTAGAAGQGMIALANSFDSAAASLAQLQKQLAEAFAAGGPIASVGEAVTRAQIGGNLQSILRAQEAAVAVAAGKVAAATLAATSGFPADIEARRQAQEDLKSAQEAVASTKAEIAAGAKKEATATKKAAKTRQEILDAEDQDLLTRQEIARTDIEIAQATADQHASLVDDIAADKAEIALLNQQLKDAQQIHDATLKKQTIQQLTLDLLKAESQLTDDLAEQRQRIRDRKVTAAEAAVESARLDVELAQTRNQPNAQIAALQRQNVALEKEKALWQGNTLKLKEIRNQIAANNQAIKDLKGETDQRRKDLLALQFSFLQTQSGFAANLLSNLIPTGAAAGTVGGGVGTVTASVGGGGISTPTPLSTDVVNTKAAGTPSPGVTQGQMAVQIQILRGILLAVQRLNGRHTHPGSATEAVSQATRLDTYPH